MRVLVTGGSGFLGQHVVRALEARGHEVHEASFEGHEFFDLRYRRYAKHLFEIAKPEAVIHLAKPPTEGIASMRDHPFAISAAAALMDLHTITAAVEYGVRKFVGIGSVCAYPEVVDLPAQEVDLLAGAPEPTNSPWGEVKRLQLGLLQAARRQYGLHGIHLILANLYGPGDRSAHVIPALIGRIREALRLGQSAVTVWGRPDATRSFLYVTDAAEGIVRALEGYDSPAPLNLCARGEVAMEELAYRLAYALHYQGIFTFDETKPVGQFRRRFSTDMLETALGWVPDTHLDRGLTATVAWHLQEYP